VTEMVGGGRRRGEGNGGQWAGDEATGVWETRRRGDEARETAVGWETTKRRDDSATSQN
jgi:hypothetical protein